MSKIYTPITGAEIADVPDFSLAAVDAALDLATESFAAWRNTSASERGVVDVFISFFSPGVSAESSLPASLIFVICLPFL